MNICGAGSVGNSLTTRLQHQWQVEDMQHCYPSLDLPAPATWDLDVSMPPEELRFAAGWQQRREGYQSSGADQGTQKPSRRAAAARAQCGPCDSPKMQRDGFWRPTHPCERLFTQSPPIMRPPCHFPIGRDQAWRLLCSRGRAPHPSKATLTEGAGPSAITPARGRGS